MLPKQVCGSPSIFVQPLSDNIGQQDLKSNVLKAFQCRLDIQQC